MLAMVLERPGAPPAEALVAREVPRPVPGAGEVLVRVEACAVCRTDLQIVSGEIAAPGPALVLGHQVVGVVERLGPGVGDPRPGERVGLYWLADACGTCPRCREGRENLCRGARFRGLDVPGGYAEWTLARADLTVPLPAQRPAAELAPLLCAGVIGYRSLRLSGLRPGGTLLLMGFGASARAVLQVARRWGCTVHVCARDPVDRRRAIDLGAAWAGAFDATPPSPADAAVTTAPVGAAVTHALANLDRGGTVAVNAIHLSDIPPIDYRDLWWERGIRSVANVTREDAAAYLALATDETGIAVDHTVHPLTEAGAALAALDAGRVHGSAVLVP